MINRARVSSGRSTSHARHDDGSFAAGRRAVIRRLVRAGMRVELAEAWIATWDEMTDQLPDFRAADDFWGVAYQYAVEEHLRGFRPRAPRSRTVES
jgi:hypothetical protein